MPSFDPAARRRSTRAGRRTGCYIYITGEQLARMGFKPGEPPPFFRTWEDPKRPRVIVNLYREA